MEENMAGYMKSKWFHICYKHLSRGLDHLDDSVMIKVEKCVNRMVDATTLIMPEVLLYNQFSPEEQD